MRLSAVFVLVCLLLALPAAAVEPGEQLKDPKLEARARAISAGLRCVVCQNQSIDESNAPIAKDLRTLVREKIKSGSRDDEVVDYIVARYGEFVLLQPRFGVHTLLLWLAPLLVLLAGIWLAYSVVRRSRQSVAATPQPLSAEEEAELAKLLRNKQ